MTCRPWPLIGVVLLVFMAVLSGRAHAQGHQEQGHHEETEIENNGLPVEASGTAWEPAQAIMSGIHGRFGQWDLMVHGNVFVGFMLEARGVEHHRSHQTTSINWVMGTASRAVGHGSLMLHAMGSAEPWTVRGCGYPDRLATGEICDGDSVHDRQHPHDLFMELAAVYRRPLAAGVNWEVYGGPAAEPALGPAAFPHRASAFINPIAPIAHHWLDSTHIAFGVVTAGVFSRRWKAEASAFNGREPDEHRTDFDLAPLDSYSARVTLAPTPQWTVQASAGRLASAEAGVGQQPSTDVTRGTASASYVHQLATGSWATTIAYGLNSQRTIIPQGRIPQTSHALLAEVAIMPNARDAWFGRAEVVGKPAHDLHVHEDITRVFTVGKLEAGYLRSVSQRGQLVVSLGGAATAAVVGPRLAPRYGGNVAPGFAAFVNLRPATHSSNTHH